MKMQSLSKRLLSHGLILLPLIASPLAGYSQQADTTDLFNMSLEQLLNIEVVSASQQAQKATEAPATIHVVTEQQIQERGYSYLDELLEDIPEVEIQRKSVPEYSNYYSIRGIAGNEKFLILLDGIRVNAIDGTPHVVGVNYPLINIKRVEVILGPASALYGADGFSGIVNLITKKGNDINGVTVSGKYGAFNTTDNAIMAGYGKKDFSFHITGNIYHSDEPVLSKYYKDDFSWYNNEYSKNGNMKLSPFVPDAIVPASSIGNIQPYATPTNSYLISGGFNFKDFEIGYYRNGESHSSSMGIRPEYAIYGKEAIYKTSQETIFGKHEYRSENEKLAVQSYIAYSSFETDPKSKFVNSFSSYRNAYKYSFARGLILREQLSYQLTPASSVIGGLNIQNMDILARTSDLSVPFDRNIPGELQDIYYQGTNVKDNTGKDLGLHQDLYYIKENNIGLFGQYQVKFAEIFNVTLGLRYDHNSRYGSTVNPRAGVVIAPSDAWKFKLLYGQAYIAPSVYKAYQHYGGFLTVDSDGNTTSDPSQITGLFAPFMHLPNAALKPEKLNSFEMGVSYIKGNIGISSDVYYNTINHLIKNQTELNGQFKGVPVAAIERAVNSGHEETYGFTTKIDYHNQIGRVKLQSYASYSYSDGDVDHQRITYSAQNTIKAGVLVKIGKFSIDPRVIYRSDSFQGMLTDDGQQVTNEAFVLVNLFTRYQITKNIEINAKVRNLLDARYYNVSFGGPESFGATPQDPLSVIGGFVVKM